MIIIAWLLIKGIKNIFKMLKSDSSKKNLNRNERKCSINDELI